MQYIYIIRKTLAISLTKEPDEPTNTNSNLEDKTLIQLLHYRMQKIYIPLKPLSKRNSKIEL